MTEQTPLDLAHAAMDAAPEDDVARLKFFERLADSELFLLLTEEPKGDALSPELFDLADGRFVLVFDREARLSDFVGRPAPYAALSGRVIASMLSSQRIGMGVNLEVAPSSVLIPAEAMDWLNGTLGNGPEQVEAEMETFEAPVGLPESLLTALDEKLATARGLAGSAYLVGVTYSGGGRGHLLGFVDAVTDAQGALARAVNEALTFSGIEAGALDVGFFQASDVATARMAQVGLRFDLPELSTEDRGVRSSPGSDPEKPPILK